MKIEVLINIYIVNLVVGCCIEWFLLRQTRKVDNYRL